MQLEPEEVKAPFTIGARAEANKYSCARARATHARARSKLRNFDRKVM